MTEDNITEIDEIEGNDVGSDEQSAAFKALRAKYNDTVKQLKAVPSRSEIEAEIRAAVLRESAIEQQLVAAGQPKGLRPLIEEKLGDAEVSPEGVAEALKAIGFETTASTDSESQQSDDLSQVSELSGALQATQTGKDMDDVDAKLAKAETPAEIDAIMREAGYA